MKILITGCAGFIGFHLSKKLLKKSNNIIYGIDSINNYYDINLKKSRLKILSGFKNFKFKKVNINNKKLIKNQFKLNNYDYVIHLAAQAGVRHSIDYPEEYLKVNIDGFFNILDLSKTFKVKHFIYASTSSVYGFSKQFPLREEFNTDRPESFYAATKKSNEVMAYAYSTIYRLPSTGLRFFTVYGNYGRPDMALFKFVKNIINNKSIDIYNRGNHERDFTHVDDVVLAISKLIKMAPKGKVPYEIYNIGGEKPKKLTDFISIIEKYTNKKSKRVFLPFQKGDVDKTHSSTAKLRKKIRIESKMNINTGIKSFVNWYKSFYKIN